MAMKKATPVSLPSFDPSAPGLVPPERWRLRPVQDAFDTMGADQCGFCTPAQILTAKALLDEKAAAGAAVTEADVKVALKDTSCRCTGYQSVVRAVLQASGQDVPPYLPKTRAPLGEIGRAQPGRAEQVVHHGQQQLAVPARRCAQPSRGAS